jgi:hypothetical protein
MFASPVIDSPPPRRMNAFFLWLESTGPSVWVRESTSMFAFPAILSAHAIGMGLAVGVNAAMALRLLGIAPAVPPAELGRFAPVMWIGFWVNAASGLLLLIGYPTKALTNPVFYLKVTLIGVAIWLYGVMTRRLSGGRPADGSGAGGARLLGAAALACWAGAIVTGRLLAYTADRILASW